MRLFRVDVEVKYYVKKVLVPEIVSLDAVFISHTHMLSPSSRLNNLCISIQYLKSICRCCDTIARKIGNGWLFQSIHICFVM